MMRVMLYEAAQAMMRSKKWSSTPDLSFIGNKLKCRSRHRRR
jgi:hypothetical protein